MGMFNSSSWAASSSTVLSAMEPSTSTPWYYSPSPSLIPALQDKTLTLLTPIVAYWTMSLLFHLFDTCPTSPPFSWINIDRYRIHESEDMKTRNKVRPAEVFRAVIFQQIVQTAMGWFWFSEEPSLHNTPGLDVHIQAMKGIAPWVLRATQLLLGDATSGRFLRSFGSSILYWVYWWIIPTFQFFLAFFMIDTWQYFLHRLFHVNKFLYRHIHSVHHRLYVPYAYGALYNHPLEGFLLDTCGAVIAEAVASLTVRQSCLLFGFSAAKTVDDHCGFSLPWDPLQFLYRNNARYHDVHHQHYGMKYNFSQPFWIHWDIVMGTRWERPERPLAAEKRALALQKVAAEEKDGSPSGDSDVSSDSGIAMVNKED